MLSSCDKKKVSAVGIFTNRHFRLTFFLISLILYHFFFFLNFHSFSLSPQQVVRSHCITHSNSIECSISAMTSNCKACSNIILTNSFSKSRPVHDCLTIKSTHHMRPEWDKTIYVKGLAEMYLLKAWIEQNFCCISCTHIKHEYFYFVLNDPWTWSSILLEQKN